MITDLRNILRSAVLTCAACSLFCQTAHAWGKIGHETIALIAQDILKKENRPLYDYILKIIGNDENGFPIGMGAISACADGMKGKSLIGSGIAPGPSMTAWCAKSFPVPIMPESGPWHYIDIPLSEDHPVSADVDRYCVDSKGQSGQCVTEQIRRYMTELKTAGNDKDRRLALLMVIHLYGDLHQPLHCINDNDLGGNKKRLHLDGSRINLHAVWDNIIEPHTKEKAADYQKRLRSGSRIEKYADYVSLLESDMKIKDTSAWLQGDLINGAALDSFDIAKHKIYPLYTQYLQSRGPDGDEPYIDHTDNKYYEAMKPITEDQIEKAGVRLAYLLEQALDPRFAAGKAQQLAAAAEKAAKPQAVAKTSAPQRPPSNRSSELQSADPTPAAAGLPNAGAADFAKTLIDAQKKLAAQAETIKPGSRRWMPSQKLSDYKFSIEFQAILKTLDLDEKIIADKIGQGVDVQSEIDQKIYDKARKAVAARALEATRQRDNWAVVLNIDDTILDNAPFWREMDQKHAGRLNTDEWTAWVDRATTDPRHEAAAIPGARPFMTFLHHLVRESRGHGHVVFISDRSFSQDEATIKNLKDRGLYEDGDRVLSKTGDDDTKLARRTCVENGDQGTDPRCSKYPPMKIVALFGDSLRDFAQPCTLNDARLFLNTLQWGDRDWPLWNDEHGPWERNYSCNN